MSNTKIEPTDEHPTGDLNNRRMGRNYWEHWDKKKKAWIPCPWEIAIELEMLAGRMELARQFTECDGFCYSDFI